MVSPVIGNYDPAYMNHHQSSYPSHSLQAQYAPNSAEYDEGGPEETAPIEVEHSSSETPEPPPKDEEKKKRKNKKPKKPKVSSTTPAFES